MCGNACPRSLEVEFPRSADLGQAFEGMYSTIPAVASLRTCAAIARSRFPWPASSLPWAVQGAGSMTASAEHEKTLKFAAKPLDKCPRLCYHSIRTDVLEVCQRSSDTFVVRRSVRR